jgi:hypothetical protein
MVPDIVPSPAADERPAQDPADEEALGQRQILIRVPPLRDLDMPLLL